MVSKLLYSFGATKEFNHSNHFSSLGNSPLETGILFVKPDNLSVHEDPSAVATVGHGLYLKSVIISERTFEK